MAKLYTGMTAVSTPKSFGSSPPSPCAESDRLKLTILVSDNAVSQALSDTKELWRLHGLFSRLDGAEQYLLNGVRNASHSRKRRENMARAFHSVCVEPQSAR